MTWQEAAKAVAEERRTPRIEWLCSDDNPDERLREKWRARVVGLATGAIMPEAESPHIAAALPADPTPDAGRPSASEAMRLVQSMKKCSWRSTSGCGCSGAACALKGGALVNHVTCFDCIVRFGES